MHPHPTRWEARLVLESPHAYVAARPAPSRDQRVPGQVHSEKAVVKVEQIGCTEPRDRAAVTGRTPLARRR